MGTTGSTTVFTTVVIGSRYRMPGCPQTSAWFRLSVGFLLGQRRLLCCSARRTFRTPRSSVLQRNLGFCGVLKPRTVVDRDPDRFSSTLDVQVSRISTMSAEMSQRMVWVDLEMTGLDIEKDQIIEMACIITDSDLNVLAEGPNLIINQPDSLLEGMSDWCKEHHGKSGLTQAVRDSKITLEQAEYEFLSFVRQHTPPGQCPLAGNSVHADKRFLDKYMPQFMYHLHYRIIDVSTIKELCRRWFPEEYKMAPHKKASHRALGDIQESIKELQYYRTNVFKAPTNKWCNNIENGGSNPS